MARILSCEETSQLYAKLPKQFICVSGLRGRTHTSLSSADLKVQLDISLNNEATLILLMQAVRGPCRSLGRLKKKGTDRNDSLAPAARP